MMKLFRWLLGEKVAVVQMEGFNQLLHGSSEEKFTTILEARRKQFHANGIKKVVFIDAQDRCDIFRV